LVSVEYSTDKLASDHTLWLKRAVFPVSSEISDLFEISDLLLFLGYFASQNKEIKPGNYFFDVCCV